MIMSTFDKNKKLEIQNRLQALYNEIQQPSSLELGEYHLGLLSSEKARYVEDYLTSYPEMREELKFLETYLADLKPTSENEASPSLLEKTKLFIGKLVALPEQTQSIQRSSGDTKNYRYLAENITVDLILKQITDYPLAYNLLGQLDYVDDDTVAQILPGTSVFIWSIEGIKIDIPPTELDEDGYFEFADLPPGTYNLVVTGQTLEIQISRVAI